MTDKASRPTKKQRELLTFIENFVVGQGYGPSYREIAAGLGYKSIATVAVHIDNLITKGFLRKSDNRARSLELVARDSADFKSTVVDATQEKWLVDLIGHYFKQAELSGKPTQSQIDDLYVLVGSLKVLGLEGAATSFIARLTALKKKL